MFVGIPKEIAVGEKRVSIVPESVSRLKGASVLLENGAGEAAGFPNSAYSEKGVSIADTATLYGQSDIILRCNLPLRRKHSFLRRGLQRFLFSTLWQTRTMRVLVSGG